MRRTRTPSWRVAPAALAARARPEQSAPGSRTPPGTRTSTRSTASPSLQRRDCCVSQSGASWTSSWHPPRSSWQLIPVSRSKRSRAGMQASTPSSGPAAVFSRTSPPVRPLAPAPTRAASSTATRTPRRARAYAAASPVKPAPTTATSTRSGSCALGRLPASKPSTRHGGWPQSSSALPTVNGSLDHREGRCAHAQRGARLIRTLSRAQQTWIGGLDLGAHLPSQWALGARPGTRVRAPTTPVLEDTGVEAPLCPLSPVPIATSASRA